MRGFFVGVLAAANVLVFLLLEPHLGDGVFAFSVIPIIVVGWLYGLRGGLLAGVIAVVGNVGLMQTLGGHDGFRLTQIPRIVAALSIGAAVGWARELTRALRVAKQDLEKRVSERTSELVFANAALTAEVAARREAEEAIRHELQARKELEARAAAADRMAVIGTLTAGIGHEINNPLAAISANLEYIAEHLPVDKPSVAEALRDARTSAKRAGEIIQNMRVFIQSNSAEVADVRRVVDSTTRMVANEIQHRSLLEIDIEDTPPVAIKPGQLGQILLNLLVNAVHALPDRPTNENLVRIEVRGDGERVAIRVTDTGGGIPEDVQARIFEPFFTTKPVGVGTGLGLWVCHHIVTTAGGELALERSTSTGTTFRISLPVAKARPDEAPASPQPVGKLRGRLLIIDDDAAIRRSFGKFVRGRHDVVVVDSATSGLAMLESGEKFDVILCDMMMPDMTGEEFFTAAEKSVPAQAERVVFMTGGAFTKNTREFLVPKRRLLEKPFEFSELEAVIQEVLEAHA